MARVGYFEIQVDDMERAQKFYNAVFGWSFKDAQLPFEYFMIDAHDSEQSGIDGGMLKRQQQLSSDGSANAYVCAIYVSSIEETLDKITKQEGKVTVPKMEVPGIGFVAYGLDTEHNTFGLWEVKEA